MKSIEIKNMRCLKDTGIIELPPITILVGENSSGKSTFLRSFPLLKQSFRKRKMAPFFGLEIMMTMSTLAVFLKL